MSRWIFAAAICMLGVQPMGNLSRAQASLNPRVAAGQGPVFPVEYKNHYGFMDTSGRLMIEARFHAAGQFHEGLASVHLPVPGKPFATKTENGLVFNYEPAFIDRSSKVVLRRGSLQKSFGKKFGEFDNFSDGLAGFSVQSSDGYVRRGYIDRTGRIVVKPQFNMSRPFSEGLAAAASPTNSEWGFIDKTGSFVIKPRFAAAGAFRDGLAPVKEFQSDLWGFVDATGAHRIKPQFIRASEFSDGYAVVELEAGVQLMDRAGRLDGRPAPGLGRMSEGLAAFNEGASRSSSHWSEVGQVDGGKWGYRDGSGATVIAPLFDGASAFAEGLAAVNVGGKHVHGTLKGGAWGYIDRAGKWVVLPRFANARDFRGGLAMVETPGVGFYEKGARRFYIDPTGREIAPRRRGEPPPVEPRGGRERFAAELHEQGRQAHGRQDFEKAMKLYTQAAAADPNAYRPYYNRALIHIVYKRYSLAARDLSRVIAELPHFADAYQNRGNCHILLADAPSALADYGEALRIDPNAHGAAFGRVLANTLLGRLELAWREVASLRARGVVVPGRLVAHLRQASEEAGGARTEHIAVDGRFSALRPRNLVSAQKTSGLFVGISNYPAGGQQSGPAHTVGSALFHEIFYRAEANRLGLRIQRSELGGFISLYETQSGEEVLFKLPGGAEYVHIQGRGIGRAPQPAIPRLKLVADLRIDPRDPHADPRAIVRLLAGIDGSWLQLRNHSNVPVAFSPPGFMWPFFGRGDLISRDRVLQELQAALDRTTRDMTEPLEVFVLYVAAHGALRSDLSPVFFTANADAPEESLTYQEVLDVIARKGGAPAGGRLVKLVVFDACQPYFGAEAPASGDLQRALSALQLPADTVLVTSTSPGSYAMYLPVEVSETYAVVEGLGAVKTGEPLSYDDEFSSKSSAFPVAAHKSLVEAAGASTISLERWLGVLADILPQMAPVDRGGRRQTMARRSSLPDGLALDMFRVSAELDASLSPPIPPFDAK